MSFFQIIKSATVEAGATVSTLTIQGEADMQPMVFPTNEALIYQLPAE